MVYPVAGLLRERGVPVVFATGCDPEMIPSGYEDVPRWEKPSNRQDLARALPSLLQAGRVRRSSAPVRLPNASRR